MLCLHRVRITLSILKVKSLGLICADLIAVARETVPHAAGPRRLHTQALRRSATSLGRALAGAAAGAPSTSPIALVSEVSRLRRFGNTPSSLLVMALEKVCADLIAVARETALHAAGHMRLPTLRRFRILLAISLAKS